MVPAWDCYSDYFVNRAQSIRVVNCVKPKSAAAYQPGKMFRPMCGFTFPSLKFICLHFNCLCDALEKSIACDQLIVLCNTINGLPDRQPWGHNSVWAKPYQFSVFQMLETQKNHPGRWFFCFSYLVNLYRKTDLVDINHPASLPDHHLTDQGKN